MNDSAGLRRWELWGMVVLLLAAAALRLVALRDVPPGLRYDELLDYRMAKRVLAGERPLYFTESLSWGEEALFPYAQAAVIALTKACDWSLRLPAALFGLLGVLATWLAARRLWGPRVAMLAGATLTVSFWSVFYSREGIRVIAVTPFHGLMVYFVWRGLERLVEQHRSGLSLSQGTAGGPATAGSSPLKRGVRAAGDSPLKRGVRAAGDSPLKRGVRTAGGSPLKRGVRIPVCCSSGLLDFILGGVCLGLPLYVYPAARLVPLLWVALFLYLALFQRPLFRRVWVGLLLGIVVAAVLAAPMLVLVYGPARAEQRIGQLTEAWAALRAGDPEPVFSLSVQALGMFVWRGDQDWLYNVSGRPVFDPLTGICFVVGVVLCAWRWRQARYALLLLWLGAGLAPAMLTPPPASLSHAIAAQPPAYVLLAVGLEALWRAVQKRRAWAGLVLVAGIVAFHGTLSGYAYFVTWAQAPQVRELYQGGITTVARALDAHDPPGPVAVGAPYVNYWHPWNASAFDLALAREDLSVRWFNPAGGWVWPAGTGPATFYFPADPLGPQAFDAELERLFAADATLLPQAGDDFTAFRVAHPAALEEWLDALTVPPLAWPPELAHLPPPALPLVFGERFALLGTELQTSPVPPGGTLRLITCWQVLKADSAPVVAFVHLTSNGQDMWGQYDWLDVRAAGLQPGDRFVQVHVLPVKSETPAGLYHVQLGLYNPATLVRLPIAAGGEATADRVWVGESQIANSE